MAESKPTLAAAGAIVTLAGVLPIGLAWLVSTTGADQEAIVPSTLPVEALPRTTIEIEPPGIEGLDPAISRVLYGAEVASANGEQDLTEIAPEVVRVLVYYDAVLMVPLEPAP